MTIWTGSRAVPPPNYGAITIGHTVFWDGRTRSPDALLGLWSHEYIHVLQQENGGFFNLASYGWNDVLLGLQGLEGGGPRNQNEAIGYLWEGWIIAFHGFGESPSWG